MDLNFTSVFDHFGYLLGGAGLSLWIAFLSSAIALILAIVLGLTRHYATRPVQIAARLYIDSWRNTPLLVQLYFAYFALPSLGIGLTPVTATVIVFGLNASAYMGEMVRGGLESVPDSQLEAAYSLGMKRKDVLRHIVLPPAMKTATPALGNQVILITLATAEASIIATPELTYRATSLAAEIYRTFEIYLIILVMYFIVARLMMYGFELATRGLFRTPHTANVPIL